MSAAGTTPGQVLGSFSTSGNNAWTFPSPNGVYNLAMSKEDNMNGMRGAGYEVIYRLNNTDRVQTQVVISATEAQARKAIEDSCDCYGSESLEIIAVVPVVVSL